MNWIDIILCVVVLFTVTAGWSRGFIRSSLDMASWAGSLFLGYLFYPYTERLVEKILTVGTWLLPLSFLITVIIAMILISLIKGLILRGIPDAVNRSWLNKFLGIIPGLINGWLYAMIISALLLALPLTDRITVETRESRFAGKLAMQSEWVNRKLTPLLGDAVRKTLNSLTIHPASNESVELPYKYNNAIPQPTLEAEMLDMVNKERSQRGLPLLKPDPALTALGRAHSRDMFARGYFAHVDPDHKDPFDRMKNANISFTAAGENLALAPTLEIAHTNLMNSPGHRANILNPVYGHLGIGILDGGNYGLMISQEFTN